MLLFTNVLCHILGSFQTASSSVSATISMGLKVCHEAWFLWINWNWHLPENVVYRPVIGERLLYGQYYCRSLMVGPAPVAFCVCGCTSVTMWFLFCRDLSLSVFSPHLPILHNRACMWFEWDFGETDFLEVENVSLAPKKRQRKKNGAAEFLFQIKSSSCWFLTRNTLSMTVNNSLCL